MSRRLENLDVQEVSLVDDPAVPAAKILVMKRARTTQLEPSQMTTQELLQKAAFVSTDLNAGGLLNPAQSNAFITMAMAATVISKEARVERMASPKQEFNKIGFSSRIMVPATEATDPGAGAETKPTTGKVTLSTVEGIAIVKVSYATFEDNIERAALADKIVGLIASRSGVDLEEQWVNGDSLSGDPWLAQNEGLLKLASAHVADRDAAASVKADEENVVAACYVAYALLPKKYIRNKREWRFYVSQDIEFQLRTALAERSTAAGDRFLLDDAPVLVAGIPVLGVPAFLAHEQDFGATPDLAQASDLLLVHPQNIVIGIQRAVRIEQDRLIRERNVEYVASVRSDVGFEEADAVVRVKNLRHAIFGG